MQFSDYIVYADESGDHSLTSIDNEYPIFVLAFCIFNKEDYATSVIPEMARFKFRHFGHDNVILHEREIRQQKPPFKFLQIQAKRNVFMADLSGLIERAPFKVIAASIDKRALVRRYAHPHNPYELALTFCMERLYAELRDKHQTDRRTHIIFEQRGLDVDKDLELHFRRVCDGANQWAVMPCFDIIFADKKRNASGLQLADMIARPIGLRTLRPTQTNRAYEIIESKFRRSPRGQVSGWGYKTFP